MNGYVTEIEAGEQGSIKVRRVFHNTVVDRYTTHDLSKPPKRLAEWMKPVVEAGANFGNSEPAPVPTLTISLDGNVFERLERTQGDLMQFVKANEDLKADVCRLCKTV